MARFNDSSITFKVSELEDYFDIAQKLRMADAMAALNALMHVPKEPCDFERSLALFSDSYRALVKPIEIQED